MHAWEAIQKAVDYIEENLQEEIYTEMLAQMVSLSPFYFQRLFKRLVNKSVLEYIKLRRLSKVIDILNNGNQRILDISLDYGFPVTQISHEQLRKHMELHQRNTKKASRC